MFIYWDCLILGKWQAATSRLAWHLSTVAACVQREIKYNWGGKWCYDYNCDIMLNIYNENDNDND